MAEAQNAAAVATEVENTTVCISDDDCNISYEYLSSEEIDPYLVSGESPVKNSDIRAAKKWPDARSCLVRVERDAEIPDIAKIDWKQMRRAEDIEVCLFRIAASIRSEAGISNWFKLQNLRPLDVRDHRTHSPVTGDRVKLRRIEAHNTLSDTNRFFVKDSLLPTVLLKWAIWDEKFFITWFEIGGVYGTAYGQNSSFN